MSELVKKTEDWMNRKWRPMMGWLYMATCTFDFVLFPILWSVLQSVMGNPITQWQPLTLQGAGLYHVAMGAVLGLTAFGRTQEKIAGTNNSGIIHPTPNFNASRSVSNSSNTATSSTGKPMPIQSIEPEL
jgi:hypothetical protein